MIDNHNDTEGSGASPSRADSVSDNYFATASRDEILGKMHEAMDIGVALMALTGEDGSGKTMLCRFFLNQISSGCTGIYFPGAIDSYEDLVRCIATELGVAGSEEIENQNVDLLLDQITVFLLTESVDLLVILDDAENIFLATLERIGKLLDRVNASGAKVHILFAGKETFLENCEQLSLCNFQNPSELHFALQPLTREETAGYLRDYVSRLPDKKATEFFGEEVVDSILALAKGNFRETAHLAKESIKIQEEDSSFMVLLEGVDGDAPDRGMKKNLFAPIADFLKEHPPSLPWVGGVFCCCLILVLFLSRGDDEQALESGSNPANIVENREETAAVQEEKEDVRNSVDQQEAINEGTGSPSDIDQQDGGIAEAAVEMKVQKQDIKFLPKVVDTLPGDQTNALPKKEQDLVAGTKVPTNKAIESSLQQAIPESKKIAMRTTAGIHESKPDSTAGTPTKIRMEKSRQKVHKNVAPVSHSAADRLYEERVSAAFGWEGGDRQRLYTVQLMSLASGTAEENLKKMLAQENYRQEAGNFFIFKTKNEPGKIFVFYGEYPSMETARLVRDSLPKFLRDHKPYALSIQGAIAKVRE